MLHRVKNTMKLLVAVLPILPNNYCGTNMLKHAQTMFIETLRRPCCWRERDAKGDVCARA